MTIHMTNIRQKVVETIGHCDNIVLKDFLDFFLSDWLDFLIDRYDRFFPKQMWYDNILKDFAEKYDYKSSFDRYYNKVHVPTEIKGGILEGIEIAYLSGGMNLLIKYGMLLPLNWLISNKGFSMQEACDYISCIMAGCYGDIIEKIVEKTESMSPYPITFSEKNCDNIFKTLGVEAINMDIDFSNESKWSIEQEK